MPKLPTALWRRMEVTKNESCEIRCTLPPKMRVTAACTDDTYLRDISDTHNDCRCAAAAVSPLTLRYGLMQCLRQTQTAATSKSSTVGARSIGAVASCRCSEKPVDLATQKTPIELTSRIQGAMHPASTLSVELAALGVCAGRTRPAPRFESLLFAEIKI